MSNSFKAVIALIALAVLVAGYLFTQNQSEWTAQTSPHQSLEEMKATGNIEVKSFEQWKGSHEGGERFKAWQRSLVKPTQGNTTDVKPTEAPAQKSPSAPVE